jgi:hypothetical protein
MFLVTKVGKKLAHPTGYHIDYIHYNPVKHGLVMRPVDWQYSNILRYIQQGKLTPDWVWVALLIFEMPPDTSRLG